MKLYMCILLCIYILYFFRDKKELNSWISPPVLESIQARVRVFLALRTVTSNRGLLADRTARLGAKKLLRALEAALAAYLVGDFWILLAQRLSEARAGHLGYAILCVLRVSNVLKGWEFKTTHIHTSKQIERKSPCFPGTTCRTKDLTGAVITSVLVFVAAVRTIAVIVIHIVLADKTPIVAGKSRRSRRWRRRWWRWGDGTWKYCLRVTGRRALAKSTKFRVANEAPLCLVLTVRTVARRIAHRASIDETPTKLTAKLACRHLRSLTTDCGTSTLDTIQARISFILTVRTVTCQIVDFVLADRTTT